jgi:hypothetical protein
VENYPLWGDAHAAGGGAPQERLTGTPCVEYTDLFQLITAPEVRLAVQFITSCGDI